LIDVWLLVDEVSLTHTATHHSRYDSSGRVISSSQRPLPDNTQHSQQTAYTLAQYTTHTPHRSFYAAIALTSPRRLSQLWTTSCNFS